MPGHEDGAGPSGGTDPVDQARSWLQGHGVSPSAGVLEPSAEPFARRQPSAARARSTTARPLRSAGSRREADQGERDLGPPAEAETVARQIVLRKLAAHARTRSELSKVLQAKDVPDDIADVVLDRMEELRLVDDTAFARDWVADRQTRRHLSKSALRRELQVKGVVKEDIEAALDGVDAADELSAARALVEKKVRTMSGLASEVRYRRLAGALGRRGFGSGIINQVLAEVNERG